jgi:hypothetical protein
MARQERQMKMKKKFFFCAWIFLFSPCSPVHAEASGDGNHAFNKISVAPLPNFPREFVARGGKIEVHFRSHIASADIDAFPEPPVVMVNHVTEERCAIEEGGIWARSEVYLSDDERVLLVNEFSGSGSDLISYDTGDCRQIRRMDVSDMRWRINGAVAYIGESCTGDGMTGCASIRPLDLRIFFKP